MKDSLKQWLSSQHFAILGAGVSGLAAAKLLLKNHASVCMIDQSDAAKYHDAQQALVEMGVEAYWGGKFPDDLMQKITTIVLSPGIPRSNPFIVDALKQGKNVIAEVELAWRFIGANDKVIAVTGTNGKTTTTSWIAHILSEAGKNVYCGGNIGNAWSACMADATGAPVIHVIEMSSYQLESIDTFKPNVAMILNVTPDHLDRYGTIETYAAAKKRITLNMANNDAFLYNADTEPTLLGLDGKEVFKSYIVSADSCGVNIAAGVDEKGMLFLKLSGRTMTLLHKDDLPIPGRHNIENALFSALAASLIGLKPEVIASGLMSFHAVEHRIELCGKWNNIRFYNDSKATNVDSLEKALLSFPESKIVLIAGGVHKHAPYTPLCSLVTKFVRQVITIGEAAPIIEADWADCHVPMQRADSMTEAVKAAIDKALPGDVVLLSPACASFDWYPMPDGGYEKRGRDFKRIVKELIVAKAAQA